MAAQIQPPEAPITSPPTTAETATETPAAIPPVSATTTASATTTTTATAPLGPTITTVQPYTENSGQPLAPKRQRRPSVRLGEIGDQPATLAYDSHVRRPTRQPWRPPKDSSAASTLTPTSKAVKARSLTNLVNGGADSHDNNINQELDERNNLNLYVVDGNPEFGNRKAKAKRGTTTKRVRSNWLPRADDGAEGDISREDGDEGYRDFDPDSDRDSPVKDHSPVHSVDNDLSLWPGQRRHIGQLPPPRPRSHRVSEFDNLNLPKCGACEGVRSWLIELGLSRYAPMFEIHEVDDEVLPLLTLEDLKDMGINAVGSRRKMYTAIQKLRKGFP